MQLYELTKLIRSKNAGPFTLTIDIIFNDEAAYRRGLEHRVGEPETYAKLYGLETSQIAVIPFEPVWAIKVSMPRASIAGDMTDGDVSGSQQHGPICELEVGG